MLCCCCSSSSSSCCCCCCESPAVLIFSSDISSLGCRSITEFFTNCVLLCTSFILTVCRSTFSVQTVVRSSNRPGLRSSYTAAYAKPMCRTKFGERSFRHAGPTAWNSLPDHQINDTSLFKCHLKTELFRRAYHR